MQCYKQKYKTHRYIKTILIFTPNRNWLNMISTAVESEQRTSCCEGDIKTRLHLVLTCDLDLDQGNVQCRVDADVNKRRAATGDHIWRKFDVKKKYNLRPFS